MIVDGDALMEVLDQIENAILRHFMEHEHDFSDIRACATCNILAGGDAVRKLIQDSIGNGGINLMKLNNFLQRST